jgi:hypothetical protein
VRFLQDNVILVPEIVNATRKFYGHRVVLNAGVAYGRDLNVAMRMKKRGKNHFDVYSTEIRRHFSQ